MIKDYFNSHYRIADPLHFKGNPWFEPLRMCLMHLQNKMDAELSNVEYAVDKIGLDMYLSFYKIDQYAKYKEILPNDVIYLFTNQYEYTDKDGFFLMPKIVAIFSSKDIGGIFGKPLFVAPINDYKAIYKTEII